MGYYILRKKVTIQDIADSLGISRNTVSKAINNAEGISDATREKILKKAIELGYKQFSYVSSINALSESELILSEPRKPIGEISLITTTIFGQSHFASIMLDRFHRELSQMGYTLTIHRVTSDNLRDIVLPLTFVKDRVRGIICIEMFNRPYAEMLCSLGIPTLFVDCPIRANGFTLPCDHLFMDNTTGISRFVYDMLQKGKRRIGFIGDWEHCHSFFERYMAFYGSMRLNGVPVKKDDCIKANDLEDVEEVLHTLDSLPDVFICANDFVAIGAIAALKNIGKSVPEDVLICGFDDSPESRTMVPPLTTIHIHTQIMGYSAAYLLSSRIKNPGMDFRTIYTETDLIYRKSTEF